MDIWIKTEPILGEATLYDLFYYKSEIVSHCEDWQEITIKVQTYDIEKRDNYFKLEENLGSHWWCNADVSLH